MPGSKAPPRATPSGPKKKACAQEFVPAIEAELARFVAPGAADSVDFEALETRLRQRALELAARAVERRFNDDLSDQCGPTQPCPCGQTAHSAGRRAKTFETVLGALTLRRADYHCPDCHHGSFPRDRALNMARTDLSPGVTRMSGAAAALVSFAQASGLLADLASVRVGTKHVQRTAAALGRQLAARERQAPDVPAPASSPTAPPAPARPSWSSAGRPNRAMTRTGPGATRARSATLPPSKAPPAATPIRTRPSSPGACAARPRDAASRSPAVASFWGTEPAGSGESPQRTTPARSRLSISGTRRRSCGRLPRCYSPTTSCWSSPGPPPVCDDLEQGRLATLRAHAGTCEQAGKCANYIEKNRSRMRYPEFRAQGLCVGSGVVEAGCRTVVGRLKRSGMYWSVSGANAILALRCCVLSGNYEDFWAERAETPCTRAEIQT